MMLSSSVFMPVWFDMVSHIAAGVAQAELSKCFFDFNAFDVANVIKDMRARDSSLKTQAPITILNSKPLSFWSGKLRRTYLPADQQLDRLNKVSSIALYTTVMLHIATCTPQICWPLKQQIPYY